MAVQRLVLIHPRELEFPTIKDIDPIANMKTLPEDYKKAEDDEVNRIIQIEDDISDDKTLQENKPEDIQLTIVLVITVVSYSNSCSQAVSFRFCGQGIQH